MFIIDAETRESMEGGHQVYEQEIRPQMTTLELKEFSDLLEKTS